MTRAEKFKEVFGLKMDVENADCGFFDCSDIEGCASCPVLYTEFWWNSEYEAPSQPQERKEIKYNKGFVDGYKKATEQANAVIEDIKSEIEEPLRINKGLNTENAKAQAMALSWCLEVIDRHISGEEQGASHETDN